MVSNFRDVGEFHERFYLHSANPALVGGVGPQPWDRELIDFRIKFLAEELTEFIDGWSERDHAKMADALIDLVYVAMGTAHLLGYPWQALWNEVQRANMTKQRAKTDGSDSARGSTFDVVKPPGWQPPRIEEILRRYGYDI